MQGTSARAFGDALVHARRAVVGGGELMEMEIARAAPPAVVRPTAPEVYRDLMLLFAHGVIWPGVVTILLCFLALELTWTQWLKAMPLILPSVAVYIIPETLLVHRLFRRLGAALESLDRRQSPSQDVVSLALTQALNMPYYAFLRIMFIRGPLGALVAAGSLLVMNRFSDGGFETWQIVMFPALVILLACPMYAMIEYFLVSRHLVPVIESLWQHCSRLDQDDQRRLIAVRLKSKLLYLCIFITALPLLFVVTTVIFKMHLLLVGQGVEHTLSLMWPLLRWLAGALVVCLVGALVLSLMTAQEVSQSALRLIHGMNEVERGNLDVDLKILGTDEYADLTRGFNLMTDGLRDEVQLLEVSQALVGELKLEVLIGRIMRAAAELLDAERSTLFLHDPERRQLWSRHAEGLQTREIRIADDAGIAGHVFSSGRAANVADPYRDPRFNPDVDATTGYTTSSILCQPIVNKAGKCIGVTQVLNKKSGHFNTRDEQRLSAFTAQIAVTLENAQLFDEVLAVKNYNENILASASDGVVTLDNQRRIVTANASALRILGQPQDALRGKPAAAAFAGANAWVVKSVERVMDGARVDSSSDADLLRPDGSRASVNLTTTPLVDAHRQTIGSLLSFEDFTQEKRIKSTMSRYMSPEVADRLLEAGEDVLGGKIQTVSILFSDVRNFTSFAEQVGAKETVLALNEYFEEMVEIIFRRRGILDKYIGDAIMAVFGSPFAGPMDADNALAAANDMIRGLRTLNARRAAAGRPAMDIGIGIATGEVVVGNVGSKRRMEYTVIGDSVNLASRLEGATKQYGVPILIADSTLKALRNPVPVREVDRIRVKGRDAALTVYEATAHHDSATFPHFDEALAIYQAGIEACERREWEAAMDAFEQVLNLNPKDRPSQIHLERCANYLDNPPAAHWDGVWALRGK